MTNHLRRRDVTPAPERADSPVARRRLTEEIAATPSRGLDDAVSRSAATRTGRDLSTVRSRPPSETKNALPSAAARSGQSELEAERAESSPPVLCPRSPIQPADIQIHTGPRAAQLADLFHARAFTYGRHIVFGRDQFAPETAAGRSLLTHELAHVLQQARGPRSIQRKEIPASLRTSVNLEPMTDEQLHDRYDLIVQTLSEFSQGSTDTALLEAEAGRVGGELSRREALRAGRTFPAEDIEKMKKYFQANVRKPKPRNCIDTMNDALTRLFGDRRQKTGDAVDKTMGALQSSGRAGDPRVIEFEDKKGRVSKSGALFPERPNESVWDALMQMAGGDVGWSVFGMGPADMSHSVTLTLDNTDPSKPVVYWSDQWKGKGWKPLDRAGLDHEVARVTQFIWSKKDDRHKPGTHVTIWRLKRSVSAAAATTP